MFFSFDGIDGGGKSTQMNRFCQWLQDHGQDVVTCRDPGSTPLGEQLREILLSDQSPRIDRGSEMLLYMAARAQLVDEVIRPALEAGKVVVSDRFLLANIVYQGYAGHMDIEAVRRVGQVATAGIEPNLTLLLDMDPKVALSRLDRGPDRMEQRGLEFMNAVRNGFLEEAGRTNSRIVVIDADQDADAVAIAVRRATQSLLDSLTQGKAAS